MKSVNIAKFKAKLGKYLGYIRHGEEVIIFDRDHPLARVTPYKPIESKLEFEEPQIESKALAQLHFSPIRNIKIDSLKFLLEERGER